ncbi:hypothetical protein M404DRAFT_1003127 [Pisolithus tinctorius Marx 270]|uniref:Uncharacterized protein n=1 Tax=Pisolithus tinctorius Marx 270 TaxID=870435 RepID=A0A0C3P2B3_PISTI|nr:hypothetical protein M404DRAFT_1003127 [Pisolithus tinctorius Marx 270]
MNGLGGLEDYPIQPICYILRTLMHHRFQFKFAGDDWTGPRTQEQARHRMPTTEKQG